MSKRMVWEPLGDGQITSFLHIENDGSQVAVFAGDDYADWYATEDLPDNIRLCRQVESDAVSVPIEALRTYLEAYPYRPTDFGGHMPDIEAAYNVLMAKVDGKETDGDRNDDTR